MISIVVCSVNEDLYKSLSLNIEKTIGDLEFELIKIENNREQKSIAEAYNKGLSISKFDLVVFAHEDILFHTQEWGVLLSSIFEADKTVGLLGVAGSSIKTNYPTGWWENSQEFLNKYVLQHYPNGEINLMDAGFKNASSKEVIIIDGLFMALRKMEGVSFDERMKGFHFYDQSISLRIRNAGYKVMVSNKILIEHLSYGVKDDVWLKASVKFHKLYNKYLPQKIEGKASRKDKLISCKYYLENCIRTGNRKIAFSVWLQYLRLSRFSKENKNFLKYFLEINNVN
ncbi:glycosyltransferase [Christiangramia sabulilitoris]|uniref:Streptomycin biosynthesis protein StrF domain-containing protein n=1 Tax=Christiangramia sabulilitoris TaxID=2583991 RepID=A0A550HZD4_9FLAO|nr:glycosyltransferase [Christiangramia sabulilitoris]TRO63918.1 hypothetical protein FGM01_10430 [Christiangramia sabulilitoris]